MLTDRLKKDPELTIHWCFWANGRPTYSRGGIDTFQYGARGPFYLNFSKHTVFRVYVSWNTQGCLIQYKNSNLLALRKIDFSTYENYPLDWGLFLFFKRIPQYGLVLNGN